MHGFSKTEVEAVLWYGKIISGFKKRGKYCVSYWQLDDSEEDDAIDYYITPVALAADFICDDLSFV